jgi:hypothetical protein
VAFYSGKDAHLVTKKQQPIICQLSVEMLDISLFLKTYDNPFGIISDLNDRLAGW